ncbi:YsnF/AvaK domain-containing protein [Falsiroseomonas sp. CW058]|uniref:YsnF/AvaK domain-containing protein n=1 Tax=Falsiroseomonas sp. CW058 TaxID=3388664 RepID=UPI003D31E9A9
MAEPVAAIEIGRLPLHEEVVRVAHRRRVTSRVRVSVGTESVPAEVTATRHRRLAEIERVAVEREVDAPPPVRQEGDTLVVPVLEERLVLVRRLVVTEEIRFRLRVEDEPVTLAAPVLRQSVQVTRLPVADDIDEPEFNGDPPSMQRTVTAMFDSQAEADRAVEALRGLGITDVRVHAAQSGSGHGGTVATAPEDRGILAAIADLFVPDDDRAAYGEGLRRGARLVTAQVDEARLDRAMDALEAAGAVDLDAREASWRQEGWTGAAGMGMGAALGASSDGSRTGLAAMPGQGGSNPPGTMASRAVDQVAGTNISGAHPENEMRATDAAGIARTDGTAVTSMHDATGAAGRTGATGMTGREESIPIAEERLRVGKREAHAGRVRVRSYVVETPVEEQVTLREERVHVERHAVDRAATGSDADLFRERVIEAEESVEEAVVQKDVRVTGEVVVNKDVTERTETIRDTVRRTEVEVDEDSVANDPTRRPGRGAA